MSQAHKLRESLERKLDQWEEKATALEGALVHGRSEVLAQAEHGKESLRHAASALAERVGESKGLAEDAKGEIQRAFEHLQVQLALGKAESRDALAVQRQQLASALHTAETALERNLHRLDEGALEARVHLIDAADRVEARLEVAELYLAQELETAKLGLREDARELKASLTRFRAGIEEKRRDLGVKAASFEQEMSEAFSHIRKAFRKLVS